MTNYGYEPEETHENMHIHRRERRYRGHKLAVAVGHNKIERAHASGSIKRKGKR